MTNTARARPPMARPNRAAKDEPIDNLVTSRTHHARGQRAELRGHDRAERGSGRKATPTKSSWPSPRPRASSRLNGDSDDPQARPVTLAFHGGPALSVWLHLGLLGPCRVVMGHVGHLLPPPYAHVDNSQTLLRHSDLVSIHPVSTGYSRAVKARSPGIRRLRRRHRVGRRGDPAVDHAQRPVCRRSTSAASPTARPGPPVWPGTCSRIGLYLTGQMLISAVLDFGTAESGRQR